MDKRTAHTQLQQDLIAGTRPALYLALGLGIVTGGSVAVVMLLGTLLVASAGGIATETGIGVMKLIGVSLGFWLGVSVGVVLGVTVGFRTWVALVPAYERRAFTAQQRAAVEAAESLLRDPQPPRD